jgi:hypothetical protein
MMLILKHFEQWNWRPGWCLLLVVAIVQLMVAAPTFALTWERQDATIDAAPGQELVEAAFPFRNATDRPIRITRIRSSCGCTTASLDDRLIQPNPRNEHETLTARFTLGDRVGQQVKRITVYTDHPVTTLTLRVNIPHVLRPQPALLIWRPPAPRAPGPTATCPDRRACGSRVG